MPYSTALYDRSAFAASPRRRFRPYTLRHQVKSALQLVTVLTEGYVAIRLTASGGFLHIPFNMTHGFEVEEPFGCNDGREKGRTRY